MAQPTQSTQANQGTNALVPLEQNQKTLKSLLDQAGPQLAVMIPPRYRDVVNSERMALLAMTTFADNEELQKCTLKSIVRALLKAARLGLEPDGQFGQGWLMAVWNKKRQCHEAQFRLGFQGKKTLTFRGGLVVDIMTDVVYSGDEFTESTEITPDGLRREFKHRPKRGKDRGELVAAYAIAIYKDGTAPHLTILDQVDIERIKKQSESLKGQYPGSSPWSTDEPEMWKKSAIGRLCKELPQPDPANAVAYERDEAIDAGDYDSPEDDADLPEAVVVEASKPQFVAPPMTVTPTAPAAAPKPRAAAKTKPPAAAPAPASAPPAHVDPPFDAPVDAEFEDVATAAVPAPASAPEPEPAASEPPAEGDITIDIGVCRSTAQLRKLGQIMAALPPQKRALAAPVFNEKMAELMKAERDAAAGGGAAGGQ